MEEIRCYLDEVEAADRAEDEEHGPVQRLAAAA